MGEVYNKKGYYFLRLPELLMLEGEEVLRQAVLLAVRQGFYTLLC
jgi:hypothetical protein